MQQIAETSASDVAQRLEALERQLSELTRCLTSPVDVRAAATDAQTRIEFALAQVRALSEHLHRREEAGGFNGVDHLASRLTLQALALLATELRRAHREAAVAVEAASRDMREAEQALNNLARELTPEAQHSPLDRTRPA